MKLTAEEDRSCQACLAELLEGSASAGAGTGDKWGNGGLSCDLLSSLWSRCLLLGIQRHHLQGGYQEGVPGQWPDPFCCTDAPRAARPGRHSRGGCHRQTPSYSSTTGVRKVNPEVLFVLGLPWWLSRKRICLPMVERRVQSLGRDNLLEEDDPLASHSSILAWEISQIEEPAGLQSMGSHES